MPLTSEDAVRRATSRGWEDWLAVLDGWGAVDRSHGEIAAWLMAEHGVDNWWSQTITVEYERSRGLRDPGSNREGLFTASASRTVAAPVERLFAAFVDPELRERWLPGDRLRERTSRPNRTARFDWEDGATRVIVGFTAKGDAKGTVELLHERLPDAHAAERSKAHWRERLTALKALLEERSPRILKTGLAIGESPRWHDGRLWLCNWGTQEVLAVDVDGASDVVARVETMGPYSIDWLPDGRLLVVSGVEGLLLRGEADGSLVTHADLTALSRYPWNEIVVDGRGNAYVNEIGFEFPEGEFAPGSIALVGPDGSVRRVADDVAFPNGMAITPDDSTLIVAESYGNRLTAFDIEPDGSLSNRRVWAELGDGAPDGICLDADGAVWYADVPNARCVRVREGGEALETVELDRGGFACMLGGPDGRTLFVLAADWGGDDPRSGQVVAVEAPAPHVGRP